MKSKIPPTVDNKESSQTTDFGGGNDSCLKTIIKLKISVKQLNTDSFSNHNLKSKNLEDFQTLLNAQTSTREEVRIDAPEM